MKASRFRLRTLLGAVALVAASCGEPTAVTIDAPGQPQGDVDFWWPRPTGLLRCAALPADSVSQTIGPEGGALQVGPHTLSVPPGALAEPVTISAVAPSGTARSVRFEPSGLTFGQPVALTMSYEDCGLLWIFLPKRIAYTTDLLEILSYVVSVDHWRTRTVTGYLEHFSTYAVAW